MSIYDFEALNMDDEVVSLEAYKGKVLLIVNTASKCGFTPQFKGLESIYETYKAQGLEIIGFPCNQFKEQDPGSNAEIKSFCELNYGVTFEIFQKIDVKGPNQHPLYGYLTENTKGLLGEEIKWNFTKFLIDREGNIVKRFGPQVKPEKMIKSIEGLL
ncbi:MAG: glutathione peroxidase [Clostridia bacterium]|nr:glutathione peroxidase [Clostridia bacterium]